MPDYLDLEEFRAHLRRDATFEDNLLTGFLDAAEEYLGDPDSGVLGRPVIKTAFVEKFSGFGAVRIAHPDGAEITAIKWTDSEGVEASLSPIYELDDGCLSLITGEEWPVGVASVSVEYEAGFDPVPEAIKRAGYFYAASLERGRFGDAISPEKVSRMISLMISGYRRVGL